MHHIERPLLLLTNRKKNPNLWTEYRWLVKKRRKEKSRYRVKESPHVPVLELPTKGGNLKQTCFERMYKKEPSLVNLNIIPSIELPTIQKPVCISRSFYKDREREECIYIKRTQFSKSKYNTLYRAESSQQCKNQFV